jgi:hypothetical protein
MYPTKKSPKISAKFYCELCDYKCCKQSEYNKHTMTAKHQILQNPTSNPTSKISNKTYICGCGKIYKHSSTLYAHKKKCDQQSTTCDGNETNTIIDDENDKPVDFDTIDKDQLILMLIKQNSELIKETSEFKNIMMEVIKNGTHNTIHTNSHNKSFNLNFFLNETCKDAMNIMDFVDSIKIQLSDLENVGKLGYVQGISKIIVNNLNLLDETKRPVHCTDSKREVMYIKDEDKWEKENEDKSKMRKVIKHVTHKNSKLLKDYKTKYPGCEKSDSRFSNQYDKLIIEAMGGKGDNDVEKEDKIIKNIAKNVIIDKTIDIE